jgi:hypothetical protein
MAISPCHGLPPVPICWCSFQKTATTSLPPARYACELIKEDRGQWRFSRRTVFHDHDYTLDGIAR